MITLTDVKDANYFHSSAHAVEYYAQEGKIDGWWQGKLAEKNNLTGKEITKEDVEKIAKQIKNGERLGLDITYSAPKSVSLAYSLLGDERIKEAHEKAVAVANAWLEEKLAMTRQGHGGKERVQTKGVAIANYTHYTSRAHDPQLHTHSVVLNAVIRSTDKEIRALEPIKIFEYQKALDQVYKNELARELQSLGYSIEMKDGRGNFEIRGFSQEIIDKFSERKQQIEKAFETLKEKIEIKNEAAIKDILAVKTREAKEALTKEELEKKWQEKLAELGLTKEDLKREVERAKTEAKDLSKKEIKEYVKQACNVLHENESAFTAEELVETTLKLSMSQGGAGEKVLSVNEVENAIKDLRKAGYLVALDNGYMTTKEMLNIEKEVIEYIKQTNGTAKAIEVDKEKIEKAIKEFESRVGYQMTNDQKNAVYHVLQSKDKILGIQGDAGSGKTAVFKFVREELEKRGLTVRGITPTGKAADVMNYESGIKTQTVDSFLMSFENMKIVDNKIEYIQKYNEINKKFEEKNWSAPPRFTGGIWDKIFGSKTETFQSQIKNLLKQELGLGKKGEKLSWFARKMNERCYVIKKDNFEGKMIVENIKTALGHYETHVWLKNEKTGDISFTRYAHIDGVGIREKTEKWVNPDKVIEKGKEVWVVDETSMMSSKEVKALLDAAKQAEARVVFVGDVKQLKAVEAGQIFKDMQENGLNTIHMTEKVRQKDEEYRKTVDALGKQDWETFKEKVDPKVKEIDDREKRLNAIRKDFLSADYKKTLIVTATNRDKNELNLQIRNELKEKQKLKEGFKFTVRESKNLSAEEKRFAFSYDVGDTVFAQKSALKEMGIKSNTNEFTVVAVDYTKNTITIQNKAGKKFTINTKEHGDKLSVFKNKEIELSKGDRIITLKNDKMHGVKNGEMWWVERISKDGTITIKNENKEKTFNINNYNYLDHSYAVTVHKSQGMTVSKVIYDASASRTNFNEVYTAVTRGKTEYSIYTDSKEIFYDRMKYEQFKTSTIELSKTSQAEKTASSAQKTASAQNQARSAQTVEEETAKTASAGRGR
jgi:conjugative relaxase-like TrwC/TraI family protein